MYPHERSLVTSMQGRPFALLGVNTDDEVSRAQTAVKENNLNWRSWYDGGGGPIVESYRISSFPTIFLVDHNGVIRFKNLRGQPLELAIEMLVAEAEDAGMKGGPPRPPKAKYRVFTAANGKNTAGTFKSVSDGVVTLEKKDGSEVQIKLADLSKKDIAYLTENRYLSEPSSESVVAELNSSASPSPAATSGASTTSAALDREVREFVDATGKFKTQARFVRVEDAKAVLLKTDGKEVKVPLDKLSPPDQEYIKSQSQ